MFRIDFFSYPALNLLFSAAESHQEKRQMKWGLDLYIQRKETEFFSTSFKLFLVFSVFLVSTEVHTHSLSCALIYTLAYILLSFPTHWTRTKQETFHISFAVVLCIEMEATWDVSVVFWTFPIPLALLALNKITFFLFKRKIIFHFLYMSISPVCTRRAKQKLLVF